MFCFKISRMGRFAVAAGLAALAGCATPPPPPPPPVVQAPPPRPRPPGGASPTMLIPIVGADGIRQTVNAHISPAQRIWNMRSGFNVAALNCLDPKYAQILQGYSYYLSNNKKALAKVNKDVEAEWKKLHGTSYARLRDSYTTQVYNYYALPPSLPQFCDTALLVSQEVMIVPASEFEPFSQRTLDRFEQVFEDFFRSYEQYRVQVAAWDAQYGNFYGPRPIVPANATYPQHSYPQSSNPQSAPPLITPVPQAAPAPQPVGPTLNPTASPAPAPAPGFSSLPPSR